MSATKRNQVKGVRKNQKTDVPPDAGVNHEKPVPQRNHITGVHTGTSSPKRNRRIPVLTDHKTNVPPGTGVDLGSNVRKNQRSIVNTGTAISLDDLCERIKASYREHVGLERARISVSNRLGADERQIAWKRHAHLGTLPKTGFPKPNESDKAEIRKVRWRLHSILAGLIIFDKEVDKELIHYVMHLPVAGMIATTPGFAEMSLGAIVGSAGNISKYRTYKTLWKRMGVGMHEGRIQKKRKGVSGAEALAIGYSEERRAVMRVISLSLIKAKGWYQDLYHARKQFEIDRATAAGLQVLPSAKITAKLRDSSMSLKHIDNRALRFIEKRFLRKLWQAWRRTAVADIIVAAPPAPKLRKVA